MTDSFDMVRDLPNALSDRTAAEQRLGLRLPAALREAYALFGRRRDLHSNHDQLLSPDEFSVDDRKEALVFREENQGAAFWGVLLADLGKPDPPVRMRPDLADKDAERWGGWLDAFSTSCIEIALSEAVLAQDALTDFGDSPDDVEFVQSMTRLPFPAYPKAEEGPSFYVGPGLLVSDGGGDWLCVRARDEETLDRFRDDVPADWLNG
ncbi:MAG: hypothetical protein ACRDNL_22960 [Spirillospora sp.]